MKKYTSVLIFILFMIVFGLILQTHSALCAPIAVGSSLNLNSYAHMFDGNGTQLTDPDSYSDSQFDTINTLNGSVSSEIIVDVYSVSSYMEFTATWNDISSGSVSFNGWQWLNNLAGAPNMSGLLNFHSSGPTIWKYEFIPDTNGYITLELDATYTSENTALGVPRPGGIISCQYFYSGALVPAFIDNNSSPIQIPVTQGVPFEIQFGWINWSPSMSGEGTIRNNYTGILNWYFDTAPSEVILVDIDIKPGSDPNCFNINGHGVIPMAILGNTDFDVTTIDSSSLSLAGLSVRVRGNKGPLCHIEDVSGDFSNPEGAPDGYLDLVCQFEDDPDAWVNGEDVAELTGKLLPEFGETPIKGEDIICVRPE